MSRYVTHVLEGQLNPGVSSHMKPGHTITIHDTYHLWHVVALYRTEDYAGYKNGRQRMAAEALAQMEKLNTE